MNKRVKVIGAGLAGCEAAWQLLKRGYEVELYEMRPLTFTSAHKTPDFAELVCSNSLKSTDESTSSGLLKWELEHAGSLLLECAYSARVEAGGALAVDRGEFSRAVEKKLLSQSGLTVIREEVTSIPSDVPVIVATGPLTADALYNEIKRLMGGGLFFFDAVAPIVDASTVDMENAYFKGRYGKGDGYLNCPMTKDEYDAFYNELIAGQTVTLKDFEGAEVFEGCMPVEVMAKRGYDTMRFGMLKPVGLSHPETGKRPYAVLQLRRETRDGDAYNMVGFQTNLKFSEQERIFRLIPALKNAEFLRLGVMHRNSYINSPKHLSAAFKAKDLECAYFAGQITGVEGYVESIMSGLLAAIHLDRELRGLDTSVPPSTTMCGALSAYISAPNANFQPMNSNFGILPHIEARDKKSRREAYCARAREDFADWFEEISRH